MTKLRAAANWLGGPADVIADFFFKKTTKSSKMMSVITSQPTSYAPSDFQTGLCDVCSDCGTCCYGWWCFPCMTCSIASEMDECCLCGATMAMRSVYRTRYNIKGSLCKDYCTIMVKPNRQRPENLHSH
ncbi:hypothetical protein DPEC_G00334350 [Dallia pectoralis]|uniref:Uncharacterized protein n=1 Tax=Dallia pectoralis TaxID=75939 RepID=A0ACC2F6L8_DALPE|nr:hypothetical protein DPEC_G00334350 [Dallia pectoralis]